MKTPKVLPVVGWRELVHLPELGLHGVSAKIDTGARTSSLHGTVLEEFERDGQKYVRFAVDYERQHVRQVCEAVHVDVRGITSSNGETQYRYVIKTPLKIGDVEFRAEVSLADRSDMKFPMLIGRSSLRRRFVVDSGYSWLQTPEMTVQKGHKP
ncbi:ATP-dependent zinc protease family protein [Qipengyuania huizhouensis]|uniref:ATP-dependent zinc protease family protein n=1 Tax=Qipengyuania huizhouensis TaxID=2867245 RepID=UPI001848AD65|nr:RimK/LysX family protein [Qipengyuania huizhouensis]MBA4764457.1 ATP-dependent zinc protease [Erythrobacter sp.]MBX7461306.1 RimK/LysX family protein [Qipengyuania huizhouensis]